MHLAMHSAVVRQAKRDVFEAFHLEIFSDGSLRLPLSVNVLEKKATFTVRPNSISPIRPLSFFVRLAFQGFFLSGGEGDGWAIEKDEGQKSQEKPSDMGFPGD